MLLAFFIVCGSLVGCKNAATEQIPTQAEYEAYLVELGTLKDSVATVILKNSKVENGKFVLDLTRDDFKGCGLPTIGYDVALYTAHEINTLLGGMDGEMLEQVIPQLQEQLLELSSK